MTSPECNILLSISRMLDICFAEPSLRKGRRHSLMQYTRHPATGRRTLDVEIRPQLRTAGTERHGDSFTDVIPYTGNVLRSQTSQQSFGYRAFIRESDVSAKWVLISHCARCLHYGDCYGKGRRSMQGWIPVSFASAKSGKRLQLLDQIRNLLARQTACVEMSLSSSESCSLRVPTISEGFN